ncbi:MAG: dienelactone hydrolase family protein [Proteobacteria bacterium]|nr:dienelactone hydrolase family protein [Pseudomonadota bacterium]
MTEVIVQAGRVPLDGSLIVPDSAKGLVVFVHGSGSSRFSPRNQYVAGVLNEGGLATLLFDLLTADENEIDILTRELRFDIGLLSERITATLDWLTDQEAVSGLPIGLFGSSTGAAAALYAAAARPEQVSAVVSRGGRPDLAMEALPEVKAAILMLVGSLDYSVIEVNRIAAKALQAPCQIEIIDGATHLFEESGKLEQVAARVRDWFLEALAVATV